MPPAPVGRKQPPTVRLLELNAKNNRRNVRHGTTSFQIVTYVLTFASSFTPNRLRTKKIARIPMPQSIPFGQARMVVPCSTFTRPRCGNRPPR
nr:hypothetical protein [Rhodococcus wratislaviensis]